MLTVGFPVQAIVPNDPLVADAWHLKAIGMPEAWEFAKGSPTVTVAVLDTGVDIDHPDLRDRIWTNPGEVAGDGIDNDRNGYVDDVHGWDFVENDSDPRPDVSAGSSSEAINHGTLVSGIIAATGGNGEGAAGVNWNARIMPLRVLNSGGAGSSASVDAAVRYAVFKGAKVINISFAGPNYNVALASTLRLAHRAGAIIVVAAGNDGDTERGGNLNVHPSYPVCYRGASGEPIVIGVASLDARDRRSSFTNLGSDCVTVSAPGERILTTQVYRPGNIDKSYSEAYSSGWSGSSLSAPIVAGVAALLVSMHPSITPDEVRELIVRYAVNVDELNTGYAGQLGAGKIDAAATVRALQERLLGVAPNITATPIAVPVGLVLPETSDSFIAAVPVSASKPTTLLLRSGFKSYAGFDAFARGISSDTGIAFVDPDGDGVPVIAVGAPSGEIPFVRLFTPEGALIAQFLAYDAKERVGVRVSAIDSDGDGDEELLVAPGPGIISEVRIFDAEGNRLNAFRPFGANDRAGARAAAVDIDDDGEDEIAVVSSGARKTVAVFTPTGVSLLTFDAFETTYRGGLDIAAGDVDGDGVSELVVAPGPGAPPRVAVYNRDGRRQTEFYAFDRAFRGGVTLGVSANRGARARILVGQASQGGQLKEMNADGGIEAQASPYGERFRGGVRAVGGRLFKGGQ